MQYQRTVSEKDRASHPSRMKLVKCPFWKYRRTSSHITLVFQGESQSGILIVRSASISLKVSGGMVSFGDDSVDLQLAILCSVARKKPKQRISNKKGIVTTKKTP
mmetsp:Transcript_38184/g.46587  ORF Transcript_38184/g.46587 Transcript_38184/m.46587 type:complete len:105 (-) Transcript_38184:250-564(-)